jgi:hypothetical protein
MKKFNLIILVIISVTAFHCSKDKSVQQSPNTTMLTGKTWIFEEITEYEHGYPPEVIYKRGAAFNPIDLSQAEHHFNTDGTFTYKNEQGIAGTGTWKLLNGGSRLELTENSTHESQIFTELKISASAMSFRVDEDQDYSIIKYVPKP